MRSPLRSPAQVEGTQGFLPQPEKDLERPSSTRLEARFPSHASGAVTRSPSPLAWRPDFPGAPREELPLPVSSGGSWLQVHLGGCRHRGSGWLGLTKLGAWGELTAPTRASCGHSTGLGAAPAGRPEGPRSISSSCHVVWFPRFSWTGVRWLHVYLECLGSIFQS